VRSGERASGARRRGVTAAVILAGLLALCWRPAQARAELPAFTRAGWSVEHYSSPNIVERGQDAQITVGDRPGGLMLTRNLDKAARYTLKLRGTGQPFSVRITEDDGAPAYFSAPTAGQTEFTIENTSHLELLFYADIPRTYTLASPILEPCSACAPDEALAPRSTADLPAMDKAGWRNTLLNTPAVVREEAGQTRLDLDAKSSGLSLRRVIDPARCYDLSIRGSGDPVRLRVTKDDQAPVYFDAPQGLVSEFRIEHTSRVELLFYGERAARYRLSPPDLTPCPSYRLAETSRSPVRQELPSLRAAGWSAQSLGAPGLAETEGKVSIQTAATTSGLLLSRQLDPKQRYRLRLRGVGENFGMRIRQDTSEPDYYTAPSNVPFEEVIEGASKLELLFFSHHSAIYTLAEAILEPCPACSRPQAPHHLRLDLPLLTKAGWDNEPYGAPAVTIEGEALRIKSTAASDGLTLTRRLDPNQRYRLAVRGSGEGFVLRISRDGDLTYHFAPPHGDVEFTIADTAQLEVLAFALHPSSYALQPPSLTPCPACVTADELVQRIRAEIPGLDQAQGLQKALLLLKWAANATTWSMDQPLAPTEGMTAEDALFKVFDKHDSGVMCGGQAVFYADVLHDFGMDAFTMNFGMDKTDLTHVTVIVPFAGKYYLLDPTFAAYYSRGGEPVPLGELLTAVDAGHVSDISFNELGVANRRFLASVFIDGFCAGSPMTVAGAKSCSPREGKYFKTYLNGVAEAITAAKLPLDKTLLPRLLRRGVFSVGPSLQPAARAGFVAKLKQAGIPVND